MLLFKDLQDEVARRATKNEGGTQFTSAIKTVLNTSLFRLCGEALWKNLRRETSFSVPASTEEVVLSPQISDRFFMWHEEYGSPYTMQYVPEQKFLSSGIDRDDTGTPIRYRMWTSDMVKTQPTSASVVTISSSSSSDLNINVTISGIVSGYPDYEIITTNASDGTTEVSGSKQFTSIDRVVKNSSSVGRITATSNSGVVTVAVIPVGDITAGIIYKKVKLNPLASSSFTMNVFYYKDPYRMVNDGDVHELGHQFDEALILLATAKINYETNKDEGDKFLGLYKDELVVLKKTNIDKIDWFPKLERSNGGFKNQLVHPYLSYSNFGSNFGPRSY